MDNVEVIQAFYAAFQKHDAEAMGLLYHPEVTFSDPVFQKLDAQQARRMWKMLCFGGKDLQVELMRCEAQGDIGSADWEAKYTFTKTGKFVHNKVHSAFHFRDGLIYSQVDEFDFWRWTRMALGMTGRLLGWTPMLKSAIRTQVRHALATF